MLGWIGWVGGWGALMRLQRARPAQQGQHQGGIFLGEWKHTLGTVYLASNRLEDGRTASPKPRTASSKSLFMGPYI